MPVPKRIKVNREEVPLFDTRETKKEADRLARRLRSRKMQASVRKVERTSGILNPTKEVVYAVYAKPRGKESSFSLY